MPVKRASNSSRVRLEKGVTLWRTVGSWCSKVGGEHAQPLHLLIRPRVLPPVPPHERRELRPWEQPRRLPIHHLPTIARCVGAANNDHHDEKDEPCNSHGVGEIHGAEEAKWQPWRREGSTPVT
uniref:Uncharacterized protein n=1 Tax=Oryza meridionalis TaxID=40149 RepID=A0A0E0E305_9ORYZ